MREEEPGLVAKWVVVVTTLFLIQVALGSNVRIAGVRPELMLLTSICAGMVGGSNRGAAVGFGSGLLVDLTMHGTLGVTALCYTLVGFGVGVVRDALPGTSKRLSVLIVMASSAAGVLLYAAVAQLLGNRTFSDPNLVRIVTMVSVWNALLSVPCLAPCRWAEGRRAVL